MGKKEPLVEKVVPSLEKKKSLLKNSKFQNIFQGKNQNGTDNQSSDFSNYAKVQKYEQT